MFVFGISAEVPAKTQSQELSEPVRQFLNDTEAVSWMKNNGVSNPREMLGKLDGITRDWTAAAKEEQTLKSKYLNLTGEEFIRRFENLYTQEAETDILYSKRVADTISRYNSTPAKKLKNAFDSGTAAVFGAIMGVFCAPEVAAFYVGKAVRGVAEKAAAPPSKRIGISGFIIKKLAPQKK